MAVDYDVVVIGAGAAGLSAALAAAQAGAQVLVVEADTRVGGSSRLSGGHFYAAGTSVQQAAGIPNDTADAMFEHYMTLNQWLVEPSVVRKYCDLSAPTFEWVQQLGVEFDPNDLYCSGVGSTARGHPPQGGGERVIEVLDANCSKHAIDFLLSAKVDQLLQHDNGDVRGVRIGEDEASCHAVVVAAGGFGANRAMLAKHYPTASKADNWTWYIGSPLAQGDGLTMGTAAGAALAGHDRGLLLVTPGFSRDLEVLLPGWIVLVNPQGRRFANETAPYTVLGGLIEQQGGHAYALFDEGARRDAAPSAISRAYWVDEILEAKAGEGSVAKANTLAALAQKIGATASTLEGSLQRYNQDCETGIDSVYFKDPATGMRPLVEPPFYAAEVRPAIICWTGTGLRIDASTRVLREDESAINGLFAAGETVGSLHGDRYIGGGGSFGPCIVFGKIAGESASAYARQLG